MACPLLPHRVVLGVGLFGYGAGAEFLLVQRALGQDDALGPETADELFGHIVGMDLAVDLGLAHAALRGGLSAVFDKFLGAYVNLERSNLEEMLAKLSAGRARYDLIQPPDYIAEAAAVACVR